MRAITLGELLAQADDDVPLTIATVSDLAERLWERRQRAMPSKGLASIGGILAEHEAWLEENAGRRWPVIRRGQRAPIPVPLRLSVYLRDAERCLVGAMGGHSDALELDHMIPWSAGGPDDSDNLRTVCSTHNANRSNYVDLAHSTALRPTTWWCFDCWGPDAEPRRIWRDGTDPNRVARIADDEINPELVFCAHCRGHSVSTRYFVGELGRDLLAAIAPPMTDHRDTHPTEEIRP